MIKEENVEIFINARNITYYRNKGYKNLKQKMILNVKIVDLNRNSKTIITAVCGCSNETKIRYEKYCHNIDRHGYYGCKKCSRKKAILTSQEKWGVDNYMQTKECKKLVEENNIKKYGVKTTLLEINTKEKIKKTIKEKYGVDEILSSKKIREKIRETFYKNHGNLNISNIEENLANFIKEIYKGKIIQSDLSILKGKELDIYIPELNIAIEFNGIYWHSELFKNKNYHLNKTLECEKQNIQLIHIFEDEWIYKQDIIKSIIKNKLNLIQNKIYARKCVVKEVNSKDARLFLDNNHIQGFIGSKYKIGLYYNNELVSLMCFGNLRKNLGQTTKDNIFELLRFCNKLNTNVVGSASKLFKYFLNNLNPEKIISYADRRYSFGNLYQKLNFIKLYNTKPNYFYVLNNKRFNRFNFRKDILINDGYNPFLSEHQIMLSRNIYRIYDSGSIKYEYKNI